ncbi:MAG: hypothetical protein N4J56_007349 [Chroococcidiopsis sp. SAG 2025]|uniref:GIY-YIG nuclease family protein n=1 Tax=Chroococcidiopsis sp. SAG 2025 TaxID=171389 RepID=UPI002937230E|nr:GIY-YIG nuclease family protein [Chroococcidiopsis sp. SAG 2025]MDV2997644.1 hypothetical protein [Chroococcidiopsis sp. SAG 2025]
MNSLNQSPESGYVYLIWAIGTPRYKIGKSKNPSARLEQLNAQSCYPLRLLETCFFDNCFYHEKRLHKVAERWRVHCEWFELPEYLLQSVQAWFHNPKCTYIDISQKKGQVLICEKGLSRDKIKSVDTKELQGRLIRPEITIKQPEKIDRAIELLGIFAKNEVAFKQHKLLELKEIIGFIPDNPIIAASLKSKIKQLRNQ